jgi:hypothetical protein
MIYAHNLIFPDFNKSKEAVVNTQGQMIGGPDRKCDDEMTKWVNWQTAIQKACKTPGAVPKDVMEYFQRTKHLSRPPRVGDLNILQTGPIEDALVVESARLGEQPSIIASTEVNDMFFNAELIGATPPMTKPFTPPRFTWSYTSMQEFLTCPAQWAAKRYYKTLKDVESEAMRVGNMIHETAEHYLKSKIGQTFKPSSIHTQYLPAVQKYCDALIASGADLHVEKEMCFDKQMRLSSWRAWDTVWVRSKADVLAKKDHRLSIVDWKTGKYKEDFLQLKMFAVFAALTPGFEDVQEFDPKFIFTKEAPPKNILRLPEPIKRTDLKPILAEILSVVRRMEAAWESETFPAKRNGLCKNWCANTDCTHCGG